MAVQRIRRNVWAQDFCLDTLYFFSSFVSGDVVFRSLCSSPFYTVVNIHPPKFALFKIHQDTMCFRNDSSAFCLLASEICNHTLDFVRVRTF